MNRFGDLSDYDFELLVADLLAARDGQSYETFPRGPDGGIDVRCRWGRGWHIVQCKHYWQSGTARVVRAAAKERKDLERLPPYIRIGRHEGQGVAYVRGQADSRSSVDALPPGRRDRGARDRQRHQWLEGKGPSTPPKIVGKFGSATLWDVYSWSTHADVRGVHQWLSVPIPEKGATHQGIVVTPEHDERLSNAMLVEVATECRDMAAVQAVARSTTTEDVRRNLAVVHELEPDCDAAIARWYNRVNDAQS